MSLIFLKKFITKAKFKNLQYKTAIKDLKFKNLKIFVQIRNKSDIPKLNNQTNFVAQKNKIFTAKNLSVVGGITGIVFTTYYLSNYFSNKKSTDQYDNEQLENKEETLELCQDIPDLPDEIEYLIIGGGTAAFAALRAIRANDSKSKVIIINNNEYLPYMKPPLSKELWFSDSELQENLKYRIWNDKERSLFYTNDEFYFDLKKLQESNTGGSSVILKHNVIKLDPINQKITLDNNQELKYKKCLIATGYKLVKNSLFKNFNEKINSRVLEFDNINDFKKLNQIVNSNKSIVIIGGNFLASELSCTINKVNELKKNDSKLIQVIPNKGNLSCILPEFLSEWTTECLKKDEGINIITSTKVESIEYLNDKLKINLSNGDILTTDYVIFEAEVKPNTDLASDANLEICPKTNAYLVNSELQARTNLWVAGTAASFYDIKLGRRNIGTHDSALITGRLAGENMTGKKNFFYNQPLVWSDLGPKIGFEGIGLIDPSLPTISVFAKPEIDFNESNEKNNENKPKLSLPTKDGDYKRGVVFYLRDGYVVGIVMWNIFGKSKIARRVLNERKTYEDLTEVAKYFDLHLNFLENEEENEN